MVDAEAFDILTHGILLRWQRKYAGEQYSVGRELFLRQVRKFFFYSMIKLSNKLTYYSELTVLWFSGWANYAANIPKYRSHDFVSRQIRLRSLWSRFVWENPLFFGLRWAVMIHSFLNSPELKPKIISIAFHHLQTFFWSSLSILCNSCTHLPKCFFISI